MQRLASIALRWIYGFFLLSLIPALSCGGGNSHPFKPSPGISLLPTVADVVIGQTQQFEVTVLNSKSGVLLSVDGGDAFGTIDGTGLYTAPAALPTGGKAVVRAKLADDTEVQETSEVNILETPPAP
jgi:hypothetical protein